MFPPLSADSERDPAGDVGTASSGQWAGADRWRYRSRHSPQGIVALPWGPQDLVRTRVIEIDPQDLADRYIAQWTVPDVAERRAAIETRVARSYDRFVEKAGFTFRPRADAVRLHDVVKFGWEMVSVETGDVVGGGPEILVLDDQGRIKADYMFPGA